MALWKKKKGNQKTKPTKPQTFEALSLSDMKDLRR